MNGSEGDGWTMATSRGVGWSDLVEEEILAGELLLTMTADAAWEGYSQDQVATTADDLLDETFNEELEENDFDPTTVQAIMAEAFTVSTASTAADAAPEEGDLVCESFVTPTTNAA